MLRLVVGFVSHARDQDPVVLYLGHDNTKAIGVIGANKDNEKFVGLGICEIPVMRKARVSPHVAAMMSRAAAVAGDSEADTDDGLAGQTIEWLETEAEENKIDVSVCTVKADYVARIRAFRALEGNTISQLEKIAETESIDLGDATKKADIINAIAHERRVASQAAASSPGPSL